VDTLWIGKMNPFCIIISMKFSILTYNVLFNKAYLRIKPILEKHKPDFLCLQEVDTSEENLKKLQVFGYTLADYSNTFIQFGRIFGVVTFYNQKKFKLSESDSINLPRSVYDFFQILLRGGKRRTVLKTDFISITSTHRLSLYNIHLTVYGINSIRIKQVKKTLENIEISKNPTIITGDFNYFPYRRKVLEELMIKYGFKEATKNIDYTIHYPHRSITQYNFIQEIGAKIARRFFNGRLKTDFAFYKNIPAIGAKRINIAFSDHFPILSTFEFK